MSSILSRLTSRSSKTSLPLTRTTSSRSTLSCPPSEHLDMDQETLDAIGEMFITDSRGNQIRFGSIYEYQKTIVIFIRHFFCGMCHSYVSDLAKVPPDELDIAGTKIVVVGCGAWDMIPTYQETTRFKGLVYSDPTGKLQDALGLVRDLVVPPKEERTTRSYVPRKYGKAVRKGIMEGLKQPINAVTGRYGNISQLGGDFILGPGNNCDYAHRMRNTMDHIEINDLLDLVGVGP